MNPMSDKDLVSRIYKECIQLINKKIIKPIERMAKDLNRLFSKEDIRMASRSRKRCFVSSASLWGFQMR